MKFSLPTLAVFFALAGAVALAEDLKSGLQKGEAPGAYNVKDITGPNEGKSLCYRCAYGARPVVNIFAREISDDLAGLIKQVDDVVGKNADKKMAAFVVVLAEDADKAAPKLAALAKKHNIKNVPLTIFDGDAGPEGYKIAKDADLTVLMWNKMDVKVNYALEKGKLDAKTTKKIVADTATILK